MSCRGGVHLRPSGAIQSFSPLLPLIITTDSSLSTSPPLLRLLVILFLSSHPGFSSWPSGSTSFNNAPWPLRGNVLSTQNWNWVFFLFFFGFFLSAAGCWYSAGRQKKKGNDSSRTFSIKSPLSIIFSANEEKWWDANFFFFFFDLETSFSWPEVVLPKPEWLDGSFGLRSWEEC